ncbi:MAG: hypothetical protein Q9218_004792 [Villophora microphyllina]
MGISLLRLPIEIRRQIYTEALPSAVDISPSRCGSHHSWALVFVCHQVKDEVLELVYSEATFYIKRSEYHSGQAVKYYTIYGTEMLDKRFAAIVEKLLIQELKRGVHHMDWTYISTERSFDFTDYCTYKDDKRHSVTNDILKILMEFEKANKMDQEFAVYGLGKRRIPVRVVQLIDPNWGVSWYYGAW